MATMLVATGTSAQEQANIWHFGVGAGLDFNTAPPSPLSGGQTYYPLPNQWNEGTSSICDSSGALLFYSNGDVVWNRDHQIMPNGTGLGGHPSSTQAALVIPQPNSDRFFYVFVTEDLEHGYDGLFYSVVDICLDSGRGDVVPGSKKVLLHSGMSEALAGTSHANGIDYWVIGHEFGTDVFHVYRLTPSGVTDSLQFAMGLVDDQGCGTQMVFDPNGMQVAYGVYSLFGHLALYDFDPATGILSNPRVQANTFDRMVWGLAFSPDATKLYLTTVNTGSVRQLDLTAGSWSDIIASEVILGTIVPDYWKDVRLGPDGRIYVAKAQHAMIGVIEDPNVTGAGCTFLDDAVSVGSTCSFGLPNVIAGYAYRNTEPDCQNPTEGTPEISDRALKIHPNPNDGRFTLELPLSSIADHLELRSIDGRRVGSMRIAAASLMTLDVSDLAPGSYVVLLVQDGTPLAATRMAIR